MSGDRGPGALVILGAGGHAAEVAAYSIDNDLEIAGVFDDGRTPGPWLQTTVIGPLEHLARFCASHTRVAYITAFGSNNLRRQVVRRIDGMQISNLRPFTLRHSTAWSGQSVEVGDGTLLAPNTLVTTRSTIGTHCIVNVKASISHDCVIEDYCNINPGATLCGDVRLGEGCYVGAGAVVIEKRKIGAWTIVGAGAVVTRDLPDGVTAVGVPARIIRRHGLPSAP